MIKKKIKDKIQFIGYLLLTFSEKDTFLRVFLENKIIIL